MRSVSSERERKIKGYAHINFEDDLQGQLGRESKTQSSNIHMK